MIGLGLQRGIVIQFDQKAFDPEISDMQDGFFDFFRDGGPFDAFVHFTHKSDPSTIEKALVVGRIPNAVMNGLPEEILLPSDPVEFLRDCGIRQDGLNAEGELGGARLIAIEKKDPVISCLTHGVVPLLRESRPFFFQKTDLFRPRA